MNYVSRVEGTLHWCQHPGVQDLVIVAPGLRVATKEALMVLQRHRNGFHSPPELLTPKVNSSASGCITSANVLMESTVGLVSIPSC